MNAPTKGGWLFEFEQHEPGWEFEKRMFCSAHNILAPISAEEKLRQVKLMISAANAFRSD
jgi:hypothetical protein